MANDIKKIHQLAGEILDGYDFDEVDMSVLASALHVAETTIREEISRRALLATLSNYR